MHNGTGGWGRRDDGPTGAPGGDGEDDDDDVVAEQALTWRAYLAVGCGLPRDVAAETALAARVDGDATTRARAVAACAHHVGALRRRAEQAGAPIDLRHLPGATGTDLRAALAAVAARDGGAALVGAATDAAASLARSIAVTEGIDESPATVAAWAIADLTDNLDVWVTACCGALDDGRCDVAAGGIAGLVLAWPPGSAPVRAVPRWLGAIDRDTPGPEDLARCLAGMHRDAGAVVAVAGELLDDPDRLPAAAVRWGWMVAGWAVGVIVTVSARRLAGELGHRDGTVLRSLLAHWPPLTESTL